MKTIIKTTLREQMEDNVKPLPVDVAIVEINGIAEHIIISAKGYGDFSSENGCGSPILIEQANGKLRIVAWKDINSEDPTIIELDGALESKRIKS